ncbi:hypothetical protein HQ571_02985 [Candidatus Kuenenbacteria bacterium]|nr:hypothetical protein [Candidatus Kuenenbacteria bacterium]
MNNQKAHVIAVDMGYGHQRAAFPLRKLSHNKKIINANDYKGIPASDRKVWRQSRKGYEFISRFKKTPVIGEIVWDLFDKLQAIPPFYPKRDLSEPTIQVKSTISLIKRKKWGKHLIDKLAKNPLPLVCTFFIPAFMAEIFDYPGEIYCLGTDTDLSRAWVPLNPAKSRIKYLAPNHRVEKRLQLYGVKPENIFITGFPLPDELVGGEKETTLRKELGYRLFTLDPQKVYLDRYKETVSHHLGEHNFPKKKHHPLTLMFAVGGAGAQRELGIEIVKSLRKKIRQKQIRVILVAGIHNNVSKYFKQEVRKLGLGDELNKSIKIIYSQTKDGYFKKFNKAISHTDILWTKPSELSFYTALGLPIIMAPPIGSQELFNRRWLRAIGSGINQEDPRYTDQWLFDWLNNGWFAEAAMQGFLEASTSGAENIRKILAHKEKEISEIKKILQY